MQKLIFEVIAMPKLEEQKKEKQRFVPAAERMGLVYKPTKPASNQPDYSVQYRSPHAEFVQSKSL